MTSDCVVYDDGVLRITNTDDPPGVAIAGEIDESTYDGLIGVLGKFAHAAGRGPRQHGRGELLRPSRAAGHRLRDRGAARADGTAKAAQAAGTA